MCKKEIIALFPADSPFKVYCQNCWWSDDWDPLEYGQDFDFEKPFFEQFQELMSKVPMLALCNDHKSMENSEYTNYVTDGKNCYLVFASNYLEDCMYNSYIWESKDAVDCAFSTNLELCYECVDCDRLFNCEHLTQSQGCSDCVLGFDLKNCKNCIACVQLRHKNYHFLNESISKKEYQEKLEEIRRDPEKFKKEYEKLTEKIIKHMTETKEWGEFFPISVSPFKYEETVANDYFPESSHTQTQT
jgi:hypothetical protein